MTIVIIKDNGETETINMTIGQASEVVAALVKEENPMHVQNFGAYMHPNGYYASSRATGHVRDTRS